MKEEFVTQFHEFSEVGRRIAEVRGGLSQADFAARLSVDRKSVNRWEAGERLPDGGSLLKLLTEFGADLNYLLTGRRATAPAALNPEEAALLDNYRHAPKAQRDILSATGAAFAKPSAHARKRAA